MRIARGGGGNETIVVDIAGVRRASGLVADAGQALGLLGRRVASHPLPEMPPGVASEVTGTIAEVSGGLAPMPQQLIEVAQELRVRSFWAEIADRLMGGYELSGAALTEFKAASASGLLTRYAEPWEADLARAYAKKLHDREHPGGFAGFLHDAGDFFGGAWDSIKDPATMIYHLTPLSGGDWTKHWGQLEEGIAYGATHPLQFAKAVVNLDALEQRGFAYWLGNLGPAVAATLLSGGAAGALRGADGAAALDRAGEGAAALQRTLRGAGKLVGDASDLGRASGAPEWLRRLRAGKAFDAERQPFYEHNELYVQKPVGDGYYRLDSYNPTAEIVSRKHSQLGQVNEETAVRYLNEIDTKYAPGTAIADVPSTAPKTCSSTPATWISSSAT